MSDATASAPLAGLRVVEVALGTSDVGAGYATHLPGVLLRDLGAEVVRVASSLRSTLDVGVESRRAWDRGKDVVLVDDHEDPAAAAATATALIADADVVFAAGPEHLVERVGLGARTLLQRDSALVHSRIRPSLTAAGSLPDLDLLAAAQVGLLGQIRGPRPGPKFADFQVASIGAALTATVGALANLYERRLTGLGGWSETSLRDGLHAILPMITGRVTNPSSSTTYLWVNQGPSETLGYRCGDGEYVQLWFGAKGAFEAFLEAMDEPPSEIGYQQELITGAMSERGARWEARFATRDRDHWLEALAGQPFRIEPIWWPGEALRDLHVREIGLAVDHRDPELGPCTTVGPVGTVRAVGPGRGPRAVDGTPRLLSDVKVADLSAYLAGPITPLVLGELGADVVKVEPIAGDVHRTMEPMFSAGQRGKRALALDLKSPDAPDVLARLFRWADVVHHNSRVGLAERLGYDEATARAANPDVVYCHASGFGAYGPRAPLAANDHLMQALSGVEAAEGGDGMPPVFLVWGAIDVVSGWVAATAVLAGLIARRADGAGRSVATSLLGAALLGKSGAFLAGDVVLPGPVLDGDQTGYGAAYRLYRCADDDWLALAVPDAPTWTRLADLVGRTDLPATPPPLRTARGQGPDPAEAVLEAVFATRSTDAWLVDLGRAGIPAVAAPAADRSTYIAALFDDPVSRTLGRVARYPWGERGILEHSALALRLGPAPRPVAPARIPGLGEHTDEVLDELGLDAPARAALHASGAVAGPTPGG